MNPSVASTVPDSVRLSAHLREIFTKTEDLIRKTYGESPPADDLMRLWLACATPGAVMEEFEEAVLDISGGDLTADAEGKIDERALNL